LKGKKVMAKKKVAKKKKSKKALRRGSASDTDQFFRDGVPSRFSNLPEGTYDGYIKAGSFIIEPKEGGGHRASCTLVVTAPEEFEEKTQTMRCDLSTQVGVNIFLGELEKLEFDQPASLKEAGELLSETDNMAVRFWVGPEQEDYPPKVRFNERLEGDEGSAEEAAPEDEPDDYYTAEQVLAMSSEELEALNKDESLELDPDDYETWEAFAEACITELGL